MPIIARTDFTVATKILIYGATIGFAGIALWDAIDSLHEQNFERLCFRSIPLLLGCIIGFVYALRHKLELSETALWQYGFRTKCIALEEIESIRENLGAYIIKSPRATIRLTTDLKNMTLFKDKLIRQLQELDAQKDALPHEADKSASTRNPRPM